MEVIKNCLEKINESFRTLSLISKKFILFSVISASASYLFYYLFVRKKKDNPPKTTYKTSDGKEITFTKSQTDFMKRKMRFGGLNNISSYKKDLSNKNKKTFKLSNPIKKLENQRNVVKTDQIFYNILSKFSSFLLRHKFAFAFA